MGYDIDRFRSPPDDSFICAICLDVVMDPVGCLNDHFFCRVCLVEWLTNVRSCPVDKSGLSTDGMKPMIRPMMRMYLAIEIKCVNHGSGCDFVSTIENESRHSCDATRHQEEPQPSGGQIQPSADHQPIQDERQAFGNLSDQDWVPSWPDETNQSQASGVTAGQQSGEGSSWDELENLRPSRGGDS